MREPIANLLLTLCGIILLGSLALLLAAWVDKWPRVRLVFLRLGDAAVTFALGFLGFIFVVMMFRAFGLLPAPPP